MFKNVVAAVVTGVLVSACGGNGDTGTRSVAVPTAAHDSGLIGGWDFSPLVYWGPDTTSVYYSFLRSDGTGSDYDFKDDPRYIQGCYEKTDFNYSVNGEVLTISTAEFQDSFNFAVLDDTLKLTLEGYSFWLPQLTEVESTVYPICDITRPNKAPIAMLDGPGHLFVGDQVTLSGAASSDPDGDALTYSWQVIAAPAGSGVFVPLSPDQNELLFIAETLGKYEIQLEVSDGLGGVHTDSIAFEVTREVTPLEFQPVDIEYSHALDRFVLVSAAPHKLILIAPDTMASDEIPLIRAPTSLSISPDGLYAAVGHGSYITHVDLLNTTETKTYTVSAPVGDLVLANNNHVYMFPSLDPYGRVYTINLSTGTETQNNYSGSDEMIAKLHPDGTSIYAADNGRDPSDIVKYDIAAGTAQTLYDSPYHGEIEMCGDLWISAGGDRIFTRCANILGSTSTRDTDMVYQNSLTEISRIQHLSESTDTNELAIIEQSPWWAPGSQDKYVYFFNSTNLKFKQKIQTPRMAAGEEVTDSRGVYVFDRADSGDTYMVLKADDGDSSRGTYAIWKVVR